MNTWIILWRRILCVCQSCPLEPDRFCLHWAWRQDMWASAIFFFKITSKLADFWLAYFFFSAVSPQARDNVPSVSLLIVNMLARCHAWDRIPAHLWAFGRFKYRRLSSHMFLWPHIENECIPSCLVSQTQKGYLLLHQSSFHFFLFTKYSVFKNVDHFKVS